MQNIVGDGDNLLEPGELMLIVIDVATGFTIEVQTPVGATLDITRQLPAELATVMQLH